MDIFWIIIYVLGVMAALLLMYYKLDKGFIVKIIDLCLAILLSLFSWAAVIIVALLVYGDKKVFEKK
jgi:hypothetical protein